MVNFILSILVFLGVIFAPFMTMGAVMYHYGHGILGVILFVMGVIRMFIRVQE